MSTTHRAKRTISHLAVWALALTLIPATAASADIAEVCEGASTGQFTDTADANARGAIDCVASYDIALGYPDDTYRPASTVQRGSMASFIARTMEIAQDGELATGTSSFVDTMNTTHDDDIDKLFTAGVVAGTTPTTYEPNAGVSRGQMASFVVRALTELGVDLPEGDSSFEDIAGTTHAGNIAMVAELGIACGTTTTTYDPHAFVTRSQMALFIQRMAGVLGDAELWNATLVDDPDPKPDPTRDPAPATPQNVTATVTGDADNDITVDWDAPNPPGGTIGGYEALLHTIGKGVDTKAVGFTCVDGPPVDQIDTAADVTTATFVTQAAGDYCAVVRTISATDTASADSVPAFVTVAGKGITNTELRFDHAETGQLGVDDVIEMTFSERLAAPANNGTVEITVEDGDGDVIIVRLFVNLGSAFDSEGDPLPTRVADDGFTDALLIDTDDAGGIDGTPETVFIRVLEDAEVRNVAGDGIFTYPATITAVTGVLDRVDRQPIDFGNSSDLVIDDEGNVENAVTDIVFPHPEWHLPG